MSKSSPVICFAAMLADIAAGAGEPSITTAKIVGATGYVLATDISSNILDYAKQMAQQVSCWSFSKIITARKT